MKLSKFINLYGCEIGDETKIGAFVEIQKNAVVGKRCKISSHTFVCEGVIIEDNVFIGHGVMFINDIYPRATTADGNLQTEADWKVSGPSSRKVHRSVLVRRSFRSTTIGENAIVGARQRRHQRMSQQTASSPEIQPEFLRYIDQTLGGHKVSISNRYRISIPFLDLVTPHVELEAELTDIFRQVLHTAGFIGGPMVEKFEKAFATFCQAKHSVAISSGTDALRFALMACGVRPGDVVVTVPHTFIATTEAISQAGALPEFVDIDERTYNMDPARCESIWTRSASVTPLGQPD